MERGPSVAIKSRPTIKSSPASAGRGELSFRIPAPKSETFRSIKTGNELKLGNFTPKSLPSIKEGPVTTPRLLENTVPEVVSVPESASLKKTVEAPVRLETPVIDPKPALRRVVAQKVESLKPTVQLPKIEETKPDVPPVASFLPASDVTPAITRVIPVISARITVIQNELKALTNIAKPKPETHHAPVKVLPVSSGDTETMRQQAREMVATKGLVETRAWLMAKGYPPIEILLQPKDKVEKETLVVNEEQTTATPETAKDKTKKRMPVENRLPDGTKEKEIPEKGERMKYVIDNRAKLVRWLLTTGAGLSLFAFGTLRGNFEFSGEDLRFSDAPTHQAMGRAAAKLGVPDLSWSLWVAKIREIPKTNLGDLLARTVGAIDAIPPVDIKPATQARGEKEAPASAIALLFGVSQSESATA